jgi:hypothetical protein
MLLRILEYKFVVSSNGICVTGLLRTSELVQKLKKTHTGKQRGNIITLLSFPTKGKEFRQE